MKIYSVKPELLGKGAYVLCAQSINNGRKVLLDSASQLELKELFEVGVEGIVVRDTKEPEIVKPAPEKK